MLEALSFIFQPKKGRAIFNKNKSLRIKNSNLKTMASNAKPIQGSNALMNVSKNDIQAVNRGVKPATILIPQKYDALEDIQQVASANVFPIPPSITVQIASATGSGAAALRCYVFNQGDYNNITNNGSGAASVAYTYQDGFTGSVVNKLLAFARQGMGVLCRGVAIRMITTSSGAGSPSGLATANPRFDIYNAFGSAIPTNFNITSDQTRSDYDSSIEVLTCVQNITGFTQFSVVMPVGVTATLTFYFTNNFSR